MRTAVEALGRGTRVRRDGRIVELARAPTAKVDFGVEPMRTVTVSWGDVATAWRSTGIPDIEVHFEASLPLRLAMSLPGPARRALGGRRAQMLLKRLIGRAPSGPSREERERGRVVIVGEAWDAAGRRVAARVETPEPYAFTVESAVAIIRRIQDGEAPPGFKTPSTAFGADFTLDFQGLRRTDLA